MCLPVTSCTHFHMMNSSRDKGGTPLSKTILPENKPFERMLGKEILLVMHSSQLNILGQTFRPIFTGKVVEVTNGFIKLDPVIIKMHNAHFFKFPTPLNFPMEHIAVFTPFDMDQRFPLV